MSDWETAQHNAVRSGRGGLRAPLLPDEPTSSSSSGNQRSVRGQTASNQRQGGGGGGCSGCGGGEVSSYAADEIMHGEGNGLKLVYAAHTEEEWENQLAEERERDIIATTQNVQKVRCGHATFVSCFWSNTFSRNLLASGKRDFSRSCPARSDSARGRGCHRKPGAALHKISSFRHMTSLLNLSLNASGLNASIPLSLNVSGGLCS